MISSSFPLSLPPGITQPSAMPPTAWGLGWPGEKIAEIKEFLNLAQMRAETGPGLMVVCCIGGPLPLLWPLVSMSAWDCGQWLCRDCLMATLFPHPTPLSACQPDTDREKRNLFRLSLLCKQSTDNNKEPTDDWLTLRARSLDDVGFCSLTNISRGLPTQGWERNLR